MMEPYNYLRQARASLRDGFCKKNRKSHPSDVIVCERAMEAAVRAPKFIIPDGGRVFSDGLRGLPETLRLPYPEIVVEFSCHGSGLVEQVYGREATVAVPRRVVFAQEVGEWIHIHSFVGKSADLWDMQPWIAAITKSKDSVSEAAKIRVIDNEILGTNDIPDLAMVCVKTGTMANVFSEDSWRDIAFVNLSDECNAVLELIEALSCSNVGHEVLPGRKQNKSAQKRGALPFDEYRTLVVKTPSGIVSMAGSNGSRSESREHLRRGHIRNHPTAGKVWVNSCVVNAGAAGKIIKDYKVAA